MSKINQTMGAAEWAMLLTLSLLWGGSFFFIGIAVRELPPLSIVLLRVTLSAGALALLLAITRLPIPRNVALWRQFVVMGFLANALPFCLLTWAQVYLASGLVSILNATTLFFTAIVAHFLTADEKLTAPKTIGVALGFSGVVGMIGPSVLAGFGSEVLAELACLVATLSYAFAAVYGRRFSRAGIPPLLTAAGQLTTASLMIAPLALFIDQPWSLPMPGFATWAAVVALALFSSAIAYVLYFRILASAGATNLLLVVLLIPVSAILLGSLLLGERLEPRHFLGMAVIAGGLAAIDGRPLRWLGGLGRKIRNA